MPALVFRLAAAGLLAGLAAAAAAAGGRAGPGAHGAAAGAGQRGSRLLALERPGGGAHRGHRRGPESILVQAYVFTSKPIARALVAAHRRGVRVEVLLDAEMNRPSSLSVLPQLLEAGIPVAVETRYNIAHNKVIILDPASASHGAVVTGSYNFTRSARVANAENLLILRGNPALVRVFLDNWQRHRAEAQGLRSLDELPPRRGKTDGRESDRRTPD
jgi:hypothetical protein